MHFLSLTGIFLEIAQEDDITPSLRAIIMHDKMMAHYTIIIALKSLRSVLISILEPKNYPRSSKN